MVCFLCGNGKQWNLWYFWASFLSWPRFTWNSKYTWCCALWQANGCLKVWMIPLHRLKIKDPSLQRSETLRQSITFILLITIRTDATVWHLSVGLKDYQLCYWQISPTDPMSRALGNNHTCVISLAFFLDSGAFKLAQTNTSDHPLILASKKRAFVPLMCDSKQMRKHVMQFRSVFYYNNENMFIKAEMSIKHNWGNSCVAQSIRSWSEL